MLWWISGALVLIALVVVTWLERKRIHFSSTPQWITKLHEWISHPPEWFLPLGLMAGGFLALAILWKVPQWQVGRVRRLNAKERFDRVNEARKTLATILGGLAFLVGGFFTWQSLKVAQENLKVSQEGQITDRFSKAIEQLGAVDGSGKKKLEVRLGGIYALEGIANESKELHWPIMEVLCTYVRENAPAPSRGENPPGERQKPKIQTQKNQASTLPPHPFADIQAILTVLGRRNPRYEREDQVLDLRKTNLRGANLYRADLNGAHLSRADLSGANLRGALLNEVELSGANLHDASLNGAHLSWAVLGAVLYISAADLNRKGIITRADYGVTNLSEADFSAADLRGANLSLADVSFADFSGADLSGADLRRTKGHTQEQIDTARGDSATRLPSNLHMPESWNK